MTLPLVLVAAVAENGVIGRDGNLPWRLPGDLRHFRALTMGKPVIMGRRTFESTGPLKGRANIVLSRDPSFQASGARVVSDLDKALRVAEEEARQLQANEIAVIGGEAVFAEALPRATRLELTEVHASPDGDVRFPAFDRAVWRETRRDGPHRAANEEYAYTFVTLER